MDDVWARAGLITAVLGVAGVLVALLQRRSRRPVREVFSTSLAPGVYFFSSESCPSCDQARGKLDSSFGPDGYRELIWEHEPGPFTDLEVDAVPAVIVFQESGRGRLYPGQPERAITAMSGGGRH
jgi:hypothetical protein